MDVFYDAHSDLRKLWPLSKEFGLEAIQLSKDWDAGNIPDTPREFQDFLAWRLTSTLSHMSEVSAVSRDRHIAFFSNLVKNPASAIFLDLMRAAESEFFIQWLQDSMVVDAVAMEPAYRRGRDLAMNYRAMPEFDPAVAMADDAGYQFTRWRDDNASHLMLKAGPGAHIVSIASGLMPELRYFGYPADLLASQTFTCYDPARIDLASYFKLDGLPTESIYQYRMDLKAALAEEAAHRSDKHKIDLINIKGFLSYALPALPQIVATVAQLLEEGGKFAFDLQLKSWTMARNQWIFLWARGDGIKFDLLEDVNMVYDLITRIVEGQNLPLKVDMRAQPGDDPSGVFVTMTKTT